jgi:hypothetical protein
MNKKTCPRDFVKPQLQSKMIRTTARSIPKSRRPNRHLSVRQRSMLQNIANGMTAKAAAIAAGYSKKNPRQSGYQALQGLTNKVPAIMEKHGLSDDALIDKYLLPALNAYETKFFQTAGRISDSRQVVAWRSRVKALDMALKIKGLYARRRKTESIAGHVKTILVDRPPPPREIP